MYDTATPSVPVPRTAPFVSLTSLRTSHNQLLTMHRRFGDSPGVLARASTLIEQGKACGVFLDVENERATAQSLLDYWAAILYRAGVEPPESALAEFDWSQAPELSDELCPYVGLDAFSESEQAIFFGRERLIEEAARVLTRSRLLAVVGPSGSGKSSLVLAGLLPALKNGAGQSNQQWRYVQPMVPGSDPLANLARVLSALQGQPEPDLDEWIERQSKHLLHQPDHILRLIDDSADDPVVMVIDQFEETFTLCVDNPTRDAFVHCLMALSYSPGRKHTLILTMRSDFESHVSRMPNFQTQFERHMFRVTPLNAAELRASIEAPADLIGLKFEQALVDTLLHDLLGEPAALPLLQFTLLKLWENRERNYITWDAYRRLGGGRLALANSADAWFESLIPEQQTTARRILLRLLRASDGLEITSNRVRMHQLYQTGEAEERVSLVLNKLISARLVRITRGHVSGDTQVEIAHEALVRNWPRLVSWIEEERDNIRQRQRLADAAQQWVDLGRDTGALLPAALLREASHFIDANGVELTSVEVEFIQASQQAIAMEQERELARQVELKQAHVEAHHQASRARRMRRIASVFGLLLVIPTLLMIVELQQRGSQWQRVENFPRDPVSALAATWSGGSDTLEHMMICAGTSNVGIGCTQEGHTWNIFQQDLPTGDPAYRDGSEFPGTVRGVQAMGIDATNPLRIAAFFWDGKVYLSNTGGVRWRPAGLGLPEEPLYAQEVVLNGDAALAIVGSKLYGSHDGGDLWMPLDRYSQPFWGRVNDVLLDAHQPMAYAATDNGLYAAHTSRPWRWQQVVHLPRVRHVGQELSGQNRLIMVATSSSGQDFVYRWQPGEPPELLTSFAGAIQSLAVDPDPANNIAAYVLLDSGEVVAIGEHGAKRSLGRRPAWPWDQAFDLLAVPTSTGNGTMLLLGHTHGLLRFNGTPD